MPKREVEPHLKFHQINTNCYRIHEKCLFHIIPFMYLRLIAFVLQIKKCIVKHLEMGVDGVGERSCEEGFLAG